MIQRRLRATIIGIGVLSCVLFFQNCSSNITSHEVVTQAANLPLDPGGSGNQNQNQNGSPPEIATWVTTGLQTSCAKVNSSYKCWGENSNGQLGNGTTTDVMLPTENTQLNGASTISLGDMHGCAIFVNGELKCWGSDSYGQRGDADNTSTPSVPTTVIEAEVVQVSAGGSSTCAVLQSGALWCWGKNTYGNLGDGTQVSRNQPVEIIPSGVSKVAAGKNHTCAILDGGKLQCWGNNSNGEVGVGLETTSYLTPVEVIAAGVQDVALGASHSCAILTGGALKCWGSNTYLQMGLTSGSGYATPQAVLYSGATQLAVGEYTTCVLAEGTVICWGRNGEGQVGDGSNRLKQSAATVYEKEVTFIASHNQHTCAVIAQGVSCWGANGHGELGDGTTRLGFVPVPVIKGPSFKSLESILGTWKASAPVLSGALCSPLEFSISQAGEIITISPRTYVCGSKQTTLKLDPVRIDVDNNIWRTDTSQNVGYLGDNILSIMSQYTVSGTSCSVAVFLYATQTGPVWSEWYQCGSILLHGRARLEKVN